MLDNLFPEFDWKGFGDHTGQNELSGNADLVSLVHLGAFSGQASGSPNMGSGSSGLCEPPRDVLGSSGFCVYMTFRNVFRNTLMSLYTWFVYRTMCSPSWAGHVSGNT